MNISTDLSHIYSLRNDFILIGITGRTGSGGSTVAQQLARGFGNGSDFEDHNLGLKQDLSGFKHNSYRKYRIIHQYAKENFRPYSLIKYKDILTIFLLQYPIGGLFDYLRSDNLKDEFAKTKFSFIPSFEEEIKELEQLEGEWQALSQQLVGLNLYAIKERNNWAELYDFYFGTTFLSFSTKFHDKLKSKSLLKRNKILQLISNNLRKSGKPFDDQHQSAQYIFTIVELINNIIKSHRKELEGRPTQIVIDSLRNPLEIMFFKQRYGAYYTIAVNRDDKDREYALRGRFTMNNWVDTQKIIKEEYKGGEDSEFHKQKVEACIQQADIHITFIDSNQAKQKNERLEKQSAASKDATSPFFSWPMQLLKYVSLIGHPGLVPPSPEERCMQLAYTAKHNSGCISRHVGAAITDEYYSVKAIGWNNTPEGQVPCILRNAEDLLSNTVDMSAFTTYEKKDKDFRDVLTDKFEQQVQQNRDLLKGRHVCFCFKSLKNACSEGKNQVHTRSLHAEESAFLQISKYGGNGIKNGKLFTTASPCELCAKKAYQLGIRVIYYIDPYPGISNEHILETGENPPEIRLFNGAIGNAYHWLYDPIMPYKDEMALLLGHEIKDLTSQYKDRLMQKEIDHKKELEKKDLEIAELKAQLQQQQPALPTASTTETDSSNLN